MRGTSEHEVAKLLRQLELEAANIQANLSSMAKSAHAISVLIRRTGEIPNFDELAGSKLEAVKKSAMMIATANAVINAAAGKAEG